MISIGRPLYKKRKRKLKQMKEKKKKHYIANIKKKNKI